MRVLVTGATGFIGRALVPRLRRDGHTVVAWVRSAARARACLGAEVEIVDASLGDAVLRKVLGSCEAVVNLAGEPVVGGRWTARRRAVLRSSRVDTTEQLVRAMAASSPRPRVLVSGSAIGYYGDRADERLSESATAGRDVLGDLCVAWEAAARQAEALGVRVVTLRTGLVLGRDGGMLAAVRPVFQAGLGGPIGSGRQYQSWIHLHDLANVIVTALVDQRYRGAVNGVGPEPVTNREFARALGRELRRPAILPVPAAALRAVLGEASIVLLGSQRVEPAALRALGFQYEFPTLDLALADVLGGTTVTVASHTASVDPSDSETSRRYVQHRRPVYQLRTTTVVRASLDDTFAFFSQAENLGMLTPAGMRFSISGSAPTIAEGTTIDYRLRIGGLPLQWRSRIVNWTPACRFVDLQERGPYRAWWHEHSFRESDGATVMEDRVCFAPPFGPLGRLANRLFIVPALRRIFRYRADVIRLRFGTH